MKTVKGFLYLDLPLSTYGIHARWPTMGALLDHLDPTTWKSRLADVPTALNRQKWNSEWSAPSDDKWYTENKRSMAAVDVALLGAMELPKPSAAMSGRRLTVSVSDWEKLSTDKF